MPYSLISGLHLQGTVPCCRLENLRARLIISLQYSTYWTWQVYIRGRSTGGSSLARGGILLFATTSRWQGIADEQVVLRIWRARLQTSSWRSAILTSISWFFSVYQINSGIVSQINLRQLRSAYIAIRYSPILPFSAVCSELLATSLNYLYRRTTSRQAVRPTQPRVWWVQRAPSLGYRGCSV
jgi:hypothetical protein